MAHTRMGYGILMGIFYPIIPSVPMDRRGILFYHSHWDGIRS